MNKTIAVLASLAVMGSAADCMAAAVVNYNNYDASPATPLLYQATQGGPTVNAPAATTYVELLAGPVGGALAPVTVGSAGTSAIILGLTEDGFFDNGNAVIPGLADKAQADFQFRAWSGATTWDAAPFQNKPTTWTQATGAWNLSSSPPGTPDSIALNIPASSLVIGPAVPEPSTIALGLLGAAALFIRRRK